MAATIVAVGWEGIGEGVQRDGSYPNLIMFFSSNQGSQMDIFSADYIILEHGVLNSFGNNPIVFVLSKNPDFTVTVKTIKDKEQEPKINLDQSVTGNIVFTYYNPHI
jgi:hypothetical protein